MRSSKLENIAGIDWKLIFLYVVLVFIGWINLYSASKTETHFEIFDFSALYGKQLIWISFSLILIVIILFLETKFYIQFASIFYLISILSLLGLFVFGKHVNGATSWYGIGNFSLQPTEFTKAAVALGVAKLLEDKQFDLKLISNQLKAILILLIPAILIILQPDPGSALVYLTFFFVYYREGLPKSYIVISLLLLFTSIFIIKFGFMSIEIIALLLFILFMLYMHKYKKYFFRKYWIQYIGFYLATSIFIFGTFYLYEKLPQRHIDRINLTLNIVKDSKNTGYNTRQSEIAIGSGGLFGKGYLEGTQTKGDFVPEQHTDYIFSTVGEEWGFVGSSIVIILFIIFILRIVKLAELQKTKFSRIYGYGIASIFFIHFTINVGMVIGVIPTIGIPLPFFSYGGSSLWAFTILLFIFIRFDANRSNEW